jgi:hypothetical protein
VQIEKKYSYSNLLSFTATSRGTTVAQHHVSLLPTRLALARWTRGGDIPHVLASERNMPMRAAWYAQAQRNFMDWLEAGGFHEASHYCLDRAVREEDLGRPAMLGAAANDDVRAANAFPVPGISTWPGPDGQGMTRK